MNGVPRAAAVVALLALASIATASAASTAHAVVSADTKTVSVVDADGRSHVVLHASSDERYVPDHASLSPNGRWLLVERLHPFPTTGRVDESTLLVDLRTMRCALRTGATAFLGVTDAARAVWVPGKPATLDVLAPNRGDRRIDLSQPAAEHDLRACAS